MSEPIWTCPNCKLDNLLAWDWATCLQKCDFCESQSAVKMTISSVDLKIKVDADQVKEGNDEPG